MRIPHCRGVRYDMILVLCLHKVAVSIYIMLLVYFPHLHHGYSDHESGGTLHMWHGIQAIINHRTTTSACDSDASLPDALDNYM